MSTTPPLTQCTHCQKPMSSALRACPHCKKNVPVPVTCRVCNQLLSSTEAVNGYGKTWEGSYGVAYHPTCYSERMKGFSCLLCKHQFSDDERYLLLTREQGSCFNCGHPLQVDNCYHCGSWLTIEAAKSVGTRDNDEYRYTIYCHPDCVQPFFDNLRSNKKCLNCGRDLGFIDDLFGREIHKSFCP
jgi:hypothetical protein